MSNYSFFINNKQLISEKILVYLDLPLMFVCHDDEDNKYLALCTDSDELTYILVQTSVEKIKDLLEQKIPMDKIFIGSEKKWRIKTQEKEDIVNVANSFENSELPEKDAFFILCDESNKKYLQKLYEIDFSSKILKSTSFNIISYSKQMNKKYKSPIFISKISRPTYTETFITKLTSFFSTFFEYKIDYIQENHVDHNIEYKKENIGVKNYGCKFAF